MSENDFGEEIKFQAELEFVSALANVDYIQYLAESGYFDNQAFINYLKYLLYWKKPKYIKFLVYPQCLEFLELLQQEGFRREMKRPEVIAFIREQQYLSWMFRYKQ